MSRIETRFRQLAGQGRKALIPYIAAGDPVLDITVPVMHAMVDAGADVIYTGLRKSPDYIARVAVDEDVDAVGLSMLSGSHNEIVAETVKCLADLDAADIKIFVGGTIPAEDHDGLKAAGVCGIYTADMAVDDIATDIAFGRSRLLYCSTCGNSRTSLPYSSRFSIRFS